MTNVRTIHVDWYNQRTPSFKGGPQLAYQGDHLSNMVVFDNAPELPNYYLLVEMKTDDEGPVVVLPEIQLEGPQWVIPNYYTQICQQITYQVCCKTGSGDYEHHSAKFHGTILPVLKHNGEPIDQSPMFDPYIDILDKRVDELIVASGDIQIDSELKSDSGNPVQNRVVKAAIDGLEDDVDAVNGRLHKLVADYDPNTVYQYNDYCVYNGNIYKRKLLNNDIVEEWTPGHWTLVSELSEDLRNKLDTAYVAPYYVPQTQAYEVGDVVLWNGFIYRCKTAISGEPWTAGHWTKLGSLIDMINGKQGALSFDAEPTAGSDKPVTSNGIFSALPPSAETFASWDIEVKRYKNIEYVRRMFCGETIKAQTAPVTDKSIKVRFHNNPYSIHFKTNTTSATTEIRITVPTAFTLRGTQEFEVPLYIADATDVTGVSFRTIDSNMSKLNDKTPVTGWNLFRFYLEGAGSYDADVSTTTIRILVYHSAGTDTDIYVGGITQIKPSKGNLIIIDDGPYYSFYTVAYPALKALGVPVTWAIDPTLLDSENAETRKLINENELDLLAVDGISEFSFHSYDGTIMVNATASEALFDTLNNIRYLKRKGLNPERIFRAAWLNNSCADPSLANLELDASASYNGAAGMSVYPFVDKYNIPRYGLGGKTESQIDGIFDKLAKQHCVCLIYLHGISSADRDTDTATWDYFLAKLSDAITAGYLNPTTYNRLVSYYSEV